MLAIYFATEDFRKAGKMNVGEGKRGGAADDDRGAGLKWHHASTDFMHLET
jgi:hypothetical protein